MLSNIEFSIISRTQISYSVTRFKDHQIEKKNTIYFQDLIVKVRLNRFDVMIDDIFKCLHV